MKKMLLMLFIASVSACVVQPSAKGATDQDRITILEARMNEQEHLAEQLAPSGGPRKVHLHGYGELHYNSTTQAGKDNKMDFHRMVIGLGFDFTDNIVLNMEVDFEHAATEMELEFAHVSFMLSDLLNVRIGSMLMPVGGLNETHEPTLFYSVERPHIQKYVIPTTWSEGGIGLFGSIIPELNYRLYLVGGLDADGFTGSGGIRGGRGKVAKSVANDLAIVGRLEYAPLPGFNIGASGYFGNSGQDNPALGNTSVTITEADVKYRKGIFELRGSVVNVNIDDTERLNAFLSQDEQSNEIVGEQILGWNAEAVCHIGLFFLPDGQDLVASARYEEFNTQETVVAGFEANMANDRQVTTVALAYYPTEQVVIKADMETWRNEAGTHWTQSNIALAFIY